MVILYDASAPVKANPAFAAGLLPPEPAWIAASHDLDRPVTTNLHWERAVRAMLRGMAYCPAAVTAAVAWIVEYGTAVGCPSVDDEDQACVDEGAGLAFEPTTADRAEFAEWAVAWERARWNERIDRQGEMEAALEAIEQGFECGGRMTDRDIDAVGACG